MEGRRTSEIRSISYGVNPTLAETWRISVGTKTGAKINGKLETYYVSSIIENNAVLHELGYFEYDVYVSKTGNRDDEFLWQKCIQKPSVIQYYFEGEEFA